MAVRHILLIVIAFCLGCSPDHRARTASKNGLDCALLRYQQGGMTPGWQVVSDSGPANFAQLNEAVDFARQVCGGGDVQIRIGAPK